MAVAVKMSATPGSEMPSFSFLMSDSDPAKSTVTLAFRCRTCDLVSVSFTSHALGRRATRDASRLRLHSPGSLPADQR